MKNANMAHTTSYQPWYTALGNGPKLERTLKIEHKGLQNVNGKQPRRQGTIDENGPESLKRYELTNHSRRENELLSFMAVRALYSYLILMLLYRSDGLLKTLSNLLVGLSKNLKIGFTY